MADELHAIPTDIIEAWAKGEYYVGEIPSISYRRLGTALFLRGWYTYENDSNDANHLAGVAKIDIKGPFLFMGGFRLIDQDSRATVFWKTEASHFVSDSEVIWFHTMVNAKFEDDASAAAIRDKYLQTLSATPGGAAARFSLSGHDWNALLDKLRTDFDADVERLEQLCPPERIEHGMLRFTTVPEGGKHRCEYYQFYRKPDGERTVINGLSWFDRALKRLP